ncbi:MAG: hypothetical protein HFI23_05160 [Lachnospiraceae bacterium]|nr:hypothetical protein [Lachnospiraceae bacterium]
MKKDNKKYLVAMMLVLCLVLSSLMGCGSSTDEVTGITEQQEETTEEAPVVEEDASKTETVEIPQRSSNIISTGDTFTVYYQSSDASNSGKPGLEVTVTDIGTGVFTESLINENVPYVYVELDIKNIFDQEDNPTGSCFQGFYGDDYKLESDIIPYMKDTLVGKTVMPGRKIKGRYYAACNPDQYSVIEMSFGDYTITLKDPSMVNSNEIPVPENVDASELSYGTYVYHNTEQSIINTAEVGFASGEGANYIYIDCRGEGGHGVIEFVGYFQEANEDNSYTVIQSPEDYFEAEIRCIFVEGGLNIKVISSEFDTLYDAAGYYELESALNLDEVG